MIVSLEQEASAVPRCRSGWLLEERAHGEVAQEALQELVEHLEEASGSKWSRNMAFRGVFSFKNHAKRGVSLIISG